MNDEKKKDRVRLVGYGAGEAKFAGLEPAEVTMMESMAHGTGWIKVSRKTGRLVKRNAQRDLPCPTDEQMEPFWRKHQDVQASLKLNDFEPLPNFFEPSISIQHLCGYNYTPLNYKVEAEKFTRWGFHCLRSKRGDDGRFWEIWYLPGFWCATEELKDEIEAAGKDVNKRMEAAKNFLMHRASFGSMDMSVQKVAMVID